MSPEETWSAETITAGGERVSHLFPNDCYFAHLSIYEFAVPFCRGKHVLDAGSGAGYGAAHLVEHGAKSVQGLDISADAVAFSRFYFQADNLRYDVADLGGLSWGDGERFDVIFSSNVLEHIPQARNFFATATRRIARNGVLIIAAPPITSAALREDHIANIYHLNIWSPRQWQHVLEQYFREVQAYAHCPARPDVALNFANMPEQTLINEKDFSAMPVAVGDLYHLPALTAMFIACKPRGWWRRPRVDAAMTYVDESFSRPAANQAAEASDAPVPGHHGATRLWDRLFNRA